MYYVDSQGNKKRVEAFTQPRTYLNQASNRSQKPVVEHFYSASNGKKKKMPKWLWYVLAVVAVLVVALLLWFFLGKKKGGGNMAYGHPYDRFNFRFY